VSAGTPANLIGMTGLVRTVRAACAPGTGAVGPGIDRVASHARRILPAVNRQAHAIYDVSGTWSARRGVGVRWRRTARHARSGGGGVTAGSSGEVFDAAESGLCHHLAVNDENMLKVSRSKW